MKMRMSALLVTAVVCMAGIGYAQETGEEAQPGEEIGSS
jgi:hypothetical protein